MVPTIRGRLRLVLLIAPAVACAPTEDPDPLQPPDSVAARAVEALGLDLSEFSHWTENGVLSRGRVELAEAAWTAELPWLRAFEFESLLHVKWEWVGRVPRYTVEMVADHTAGLRGSPWVQPTPSGDEHFVLGRTEGWPQGREAEGGFRLVAGDPSVPPHDIYGYAITDPGSDGPKLTVVVTAGNHPSEVHGSWALHGLVDFLVSDEPGAAEIRRGAVFYVYPLVNPDGRYLQGTREPTVPPDLYRQTRGNPALQATGVSTDHNRIWHTSGATATIDVLTSAMKRDTGGRADYLWDFHGSHPHDPGDFRTASDLDAPYARALEARDAPYPEVERRRSGGSEGMIRHWSMQEEGLAVPYAFTFEPGRQLDVRRVLEAGSNVALAFLDVLPARGSGGQARSGAR